MPTMLDPARLAQCERSLLRANEVREWRADLKARLRAAEVRLVEVFEEGDDRLEGMKVLDLIRAIPSVGSVTAESWLRSAPVRLSPTTTVGRMTGRQRDLLLVLAAQRERGDTWRRRRAAAIARGRSCS